MLLPWRDSTIVRTATLDTDTEYWYEKMRSLDRLCLTIVSQQLSASPQQSETL